MRRHPGVINQIVDLRIGGEYFACSRNASLRSICTPSRAPTPGRYSALGSALDRNSPKSCFSLACESLSMYSMWPA
jgi:hypothetical protein